MMEPLDVSLLMGRKSSSMKDNQKRGTAVLTLCLATSLLLGLAHWWGHDNTASFLAYNAGPTNVASTVAPTIRQQHLSWQMPTAEPMGTRAQLTAAALSEAAAELVEEQAIADQDQGILPTQRFQQFVRGLALAVPFMVTLLGVKQQLSADNSQSVEDAFDDGDRKASRRWLTGLGVLAGLCMFPAVGYAASAALPATASSTPFTLQTAIGSGFAQAFSLIFFSEVGDKTFFIAGLLAVKYGRLVSYIGSMAALVAMSVIAVLMGQIFHAVPTSLTNGFPFDDLAATILFAYFGFQAIKEAASMPPGGTSGKMDEELEEAEDVVEDFGKKLTDSKFWSLFISTCSLVFAAEFGDKSFLATIGLSAAQNPISVTFGAIAGHGVATAIAVVGGAIISKYLSERVICFISGGFFLTFAITTLLTLFGIPVPLPF